MSSTDDDPGLVPAAEGDEQPTAAADNKRILYFADPMCSWCWGFSPVMAQIRQAVGSIPVRLCLGGLRAGETRPMHDRAKSEVRHHWEQVTATTGQRFNFAFFEREGFVYNTLPACRAAVVMRSFSPSVTLDYLAALHDAFYVHNRDITDMAELAAIAAPFGISEDAFTALFEAEDIARSLAADLRLTQSLGIGGFPTVVLQNGQNLSLLTSGYVAYEELAAPLQAWLAA